MEIDLGILGKAYVQDMEPFKTEIGNIVGDGYTEQGIRVHLVEDATFEGNTCWRNSICLQV